MKIFSTLTITLLIIFQTVGFAATEIFSASGEYLMSDYDTPEIAEEIALDFAKQNAAEQAGIYLESYSRSVNFNLEQDEIKTVASAKVEVLEKNINRQAQSDGKILLRADIQATVDTYELDNFLKQTREQRQQAIQQYKVLQEMNAKIKQDIETFQTKLATIKDEVKDDDLIVEQERINREFLAMQKLDDLKKLHFDDYVSKQKLSDEAIKINPRNGTAYTKRADATYMEGISPTEVIKDYTRAMSLEPNNANHYDDRASFYEDIFEFGNAIKDWDRALELDPETWSAVFHLYYFYHKNGSEYERGIEHLTKIINRYPQNSYAYEYRGDFYERIKDYPHAIEDYTRALELIPKDNLSFKLILEDKAECYRELKDYSHAIKGYEKLAEIDLRYACNGISSMYRFDKKDYLGGIKYFTKMIERYPNKSEPYDGRAKLYGASENYPKAIEDYKRAIKLETSSVYRMSQCKEVVAAYKKLGDTNSALKFCDELIASDPNNYEYYVLRGNFYNELKDNDNAFTDYTAAIELVPDKMKEYYYRNRIALYTKLKDYDRAAEECKRIIELEPDYVHSYADLVELYKKTGDQEKLAKVYDEAIERNPDNVYFRLARGTLDDYNHAIRLQPGNKNIYKQRGDFYAKRGDYDLAIADYNKAIEIDPRFTKCYDARAEAYFEKENYVQALADCNRAIELDPGNRGYSIRYEKRGMVYEKLGEYEKAFYDYNTAIEIPKKYPSDLPYNAYFAKENRKKLLAKLIAEGAVFEVNDKESLMARAEAYATAKKYDLAIKDYTKALELAPTDVSVWMSRAKAYENSGQYDLALNDSAKALELSPKDASIYDFRGECYSYRLHDFKQVVKNYTKAIEINSKYSIYYRRRGYGYENMEDYQNALKDYTQAITLDPDSGYSYKSRARVYEFLGENDKALADYNKAATVYHSVSDAKKERERLEKEMSTLKSPEEIKANVFLKRAYFLRELGNPKGALKNYSQAIKLTPNNSEAYSGRGVAYENLGELEKALADYDKALELDPNNELAKKKRSPLLEKINAVKLPDKTVLLEQGNSYQKDNKHDLAVKEYTKALELDSNYQDAYFKRALSYLELGDNEKALFDLNKLIELNPNYHSNAYNNRGAVYKNQKQYEKAIENFTRALELDPQNTLALKNRGDCYEDLNNYNEAVEDYSQALELDPNYQDAYFKRAFAYIQLGDNEKALFDLNKLIELNPNYHSNAYNNRGAVYKNQKQYEKAIENFTRALELDPQNTFALKNRGGCYQELNNYNAAVEDYSRALEVDPNYQDAYFYRGMVYLFMKKYDSALADYNKLLALNSNYSGSAYSNRGYAYENLGDLEKALADYDKAIELEPNNDIAKNNRQRTLDKMKK